MKSRGTESSQSRWQTGSGNERGSPVGRQGMRSKLRKTCCFFTRFSFWSAWSPQRSSKDSAKDRGYNTGYRSKTRRKQCFSHFVPQPAHNKQYLGNFPRRKLSLCIIESQNIPSGKGLTSFAVPAQQCCTNCRFSSLPRYANVAFPFVSHFEFTEYTQLFFHNKESQVT